MEIGHLRRTCHQIHVNIASIAITTRHSMLKQQFIPTMVSTLIGVTEEKTLSTVNSWVTFNFVTQPVLLANINYVLVIWTSDTTHVSVYYDSGGQSLQGTGTYHTWPATISNQGTSKYSIYCNYSIGSAIHRQS